MDYGPHGIRANGYCAWVNRDGTLRDATPGTERDLGEQMRRLHPLGPVGRPEEVAAVVTHLLSREASYVNGGVVPIDGGRAVLGLDPEARDLGP
ncbi:MAG: SDR family oxidoreductase [Actinomycetota bacterium]|nr:SDR family oxidoreductase [Actinomycetota bacterium]